MQVGFIGLGKMGSRMAEKLIKDGHDLIVWNRSEQTTHEFKLKITGQNFKIAEDVRDLVLNLNNPRIIWIMLPAGEVTESVLGEISQYVEKGDVLIDGGNSNYKDTQKRYEQFKKIGIEFLGIGVSGGIIAEKQGYPLMAGGSKTGFEIIKPILKSLVKPNGGYEYFGQGGAGHFVKMIHNGIEYGIMQSMAEGFEVLEKSEYNFDLYKISKLYQKGTLLSGFMMDRVADVLEKDPSLANIIGEVSASGEGDWTVEAAKEEGVDAEIIEKSLQYRKRSKTDSKIQDSFTAKLLAALRNAFGGHEVKKRNM